MILILQTTLAWTTHIRSRIHALVSNGLSVALAWAHDRKVTLWGRPPTCRFEGAPPPRYIILSAREVSDSLRSQRHRNRQAGGLPHRVTFLSRIPLALLMLIGLSGWMAMAGEPALQLRKARLNVMYSSTLFSGVNRNDALVAIRVWNESIGRSRGFLLETETKTFDHLEEVEKEVQDNTVDIVFFDTIQYLHTSQSGKLDPQFVPVNQSGAVPDDYVVVVRQDRNLKTLADLRGKSVVFYKLGSDWGRLWMDVTLGEEELGSVGNFFGSNSESSKPSSVILPVFFSTTDVAVVKRRSLNVMAELNPQLAAQLQILTNSSVFPEAVACIHKDYKVYKDDLLQAMAETHNEPKGKQILLLFKTEKLTAFKPECLDSARELLARQAKLMAMPARDEFVKEPEGKPKP